MAKFEAKASWRTATVTSASPAKCWRLSKQHVQHILTSMECAAVLQASSTVYKQRERLRSSAKIEQPVVIDWLSTSLELTTSPCEKLPALCGLDSPHPGIGRQRCPDSHSTRPCNSRASKSLARRADGRFRTRLSSSSDAPCSRASRSL